MNILVTLLTQGSREGSRQHPRRGSPDALQTWKELGGTCQTAAEQRQSCEAQRPADRKAKALDAAPRDVTWKVRGQRLPAHGLWNPLPEPSARLFRGRGQKREPVRASIWEVCFPLRRTKDLKQTLPV